MLPLKWKFRTKDSECYYGQHKKFYIPNQPKNPTKSMSIQKTNSGSTTISQKLIPAPLIRLKWAAFVGVFKMRLFMNQSSFSQVKKRGPHEFEQGEGCGNRALYRQTPCHFLPICVCCQRWLISRLLSIYDNFKNKRRWINCKKRWQSDQNAYSIDSLHWWLSLRLINRRL